MHGGLVRLVALSTWALACMLSVAAAPYEGRALPGAGLSSNAHRSDPSGAYGGLKSPRPPLRSKGDVRDNDNKQPYYYRYYSDTDRSPGSCRRFARRAIVTKNANWWTRYRACLN